MKEAFLSAETVHRTLSRALERGGDFADVFAEVTSRVNLTLSEDRIKEIMASTDRGTGVRVVAGNATGYSFTESFEDGAVLEAASTASSASREGTGTVLAPLSKLRERPVPVLTAAPQSVPLEEKVLLLRRVNAAARAVDPAVTNVRITYWEVDRAFEVGNAEGTHARDRSQLVNLSVMVTARRGEVRRNGVQMRGGPIDFGVLENEGESIGRGAAEGAIRMLDARSAPAGKMPVVLCNGAGGGGVVFHEACGHALESDAILQGASIYSGKRGQRIGSPLVNLYDDGTREGMPGGFRFDDEGSVPERTALIVEGELCGYMCDLAGARALGDPPTGNGRRESFRHPPLPRMRCTYLGSGKDDPKDLISSVEDGIYVAKISGGGGEMSGAGFLFSAMEA
ncbi:MAG: TldD/PmbA family protein, partial [Planctomycetota bacterium]